MSPHNTCEAVAVRCIDFRIQKFLNAYLDEKFPGSYDCLSLAGGVKHLLDDGEEYNTALHNLRISHSLHYPSRIVLIQHEDCGAYGGCVAFENDFEKELAFHKQQMEQAEELLKQHFPEASIEKLLIRLSGELLSI
ncbi:MAG: hypothetical protein Q8P70_01280 [bacterium]|nr:hypothetical protein [bacterium]